MVAGSRQLSKPASTARATRVEGISATTGTPTTASTSLRPSARPGLVEEDDAQYPPRQLVARRSARLARTDQQQRVLGPVEEGTRWNNAGIDDHDGLGRPRPGPLPRGPAGAAGSTESTADELDAAPRWRRASAVLAADRAVGDDPVTESRIGVLRQAESGGEVGAEIDRRRSPSGWSGRGATTRGSHDGGAAAALHGPADDEHGDPRGAGTNRLGKWGEASRRHTRLHQPACGISMRSAGRRCRRSVPIGGVRAPGGLRRLQSGWDGRSPSGGFDSRPPPPTTPARSLRTLTFHVWTKSTARSI